MSELYGDHDSFGADGSGRLIPEGMRRLIGAALFLGVVGAMGLWAYRLGTRDAAEVPIIRAMEGPARIQPEDPGGLRAAHQGLEVNSVLAGQPEAASGAPAAAPLAPPPTLLAEEDGPQGELVIATPAPLADVELGPDADLRMPPADDGGAAAGQPADPDGIASAAAGPAAEDAPVVDATSLAALVEAAVEPQDGVTPGPRPLRRPANLVRARAAPPATAAGPAAAPAAAAPAAREVADVRAGARLIQLGAYDSEANTRQAWSQLVARYGDLLGAKNLYIERTTANARVFYRLRVAGFENTDQTREMCEALRARGVDCIPVTLQ